MISKEMKVAPFVLAGTIAFPLAGLAGDGPAPQTPPRVTKAASSQKAAALSQRAIKESRDRVRDQQRQLHEQATAEVRSELRTQGIAIVRQEVRQSIEDAKRQSREQIRKLLDETKDLLRSDSERIGP
jgi:hypothetical protein